MIRKTKFIFWHIVNFKYSFQLVIHFINFFIKKKTKPKQELQNWIDFNLIKIEEFFERYQFKIKDFYFDDKTNVEEAEKIEKDLKNSIVKWDKSKIGGRAHLNLLYNLVHLKNPKIVLETGVAFGWSSLAILSAKKKDPNFQLISIDMRYPLIKDYQKYRGILVQDKSKWHLIDAIDFFGIFIADNFLNKQKYDLIHYDSDKTYFGRRISYFRLWKRLNKDGYFLSDDISDNMAFYDFCSKLNLIPKIFKINNRYVGLLKKEI